MYTSYMYDRLMQAEQELSEARDPKMIEMLTEEIAQLWLMLDECI